LKAALSACQSVIRYMQKHPIAGLPSTQMVLAGFAQESRRPDIGEHVVAGSSRHHGNVTLSPLNHQIFQKLLCYISIAALVL
jgi:hypothetical protein